ncbi:MAG: glycerophosphodiester phosphodiesterase [Promethearchaeota archaeon]|jgi:glycerophosphoryl diester phosphodiesterase
MSKTIIWGHRGAGFRGVENSMSSFKKAVDMGVDGIKTEAQLLKDGDIILKFYPFIFIEGNKTLLKELNIEDIKQVKLENNESIPTLRNILEEFDDKIRYNFDIFSVETGLKIIDIAKEYDLLDKVEISKPVAYRGTNESLFKPLRDKNKDITLVCSLFSDKQISQDNYRLLSQMREMNVQVINLNHHRFNLEVFKRIKEAGFKFYLWAVLFKYFMKKYLNLNYEGEIVDGIYTNFPDKAIELRDLKSF